MRAMKSAIVTQPTAFGDFSLFSVFGIGRKNGAKAEYV
jgi:hypothetical protein